VSVHIDDSTIQQLATVLSGGDSKWPVLFATGALNATIYLANWAVASYKDRFAAESLLRRARSELEKLDRLLNRPLTEEERFKIERHLASDKDLLRIDNLKEIGNGFFRAVEGLEDSVRESGAVQRYAWWSYNCTKARQLVEKVLEHRQDVYNSTEPIRHSIQIPRRRNKPSAEEELRTIAVSAQQLVSNGQGNASVTFSWSDDPSELDITAMV